MVNKTKKPFKLFRVGDSCLRTSNWAWTSCLGRLSLCAPCEHSTALETSHKLIIGPRSFSLPDEHAVSCQQPQECVDSNPFSCAPSPDSTRLLVLLLFIVGLLIQISHLC